jgi:hypothetical protein
VHPRINTGVDGMHVFFVGDGTAEWNRVGASPRRVRYGDTSPPPRIDPMSEILAFQAILFVCATTAFVASLDFSVDFSSSNTSVYSVLPLMGSWSD